MLSAMGFWIGGFLILLGFLTALNAAVEGVLGYLAARDVEMLSEREARRIAGRE